MCDQIKVFVGRGLTGGFAWVNVVVFDTIGWSDHLDVFEARDGVHHGLLQFFREAAGNAVGVYHIWELIVSSRMQKKKKIAHTRIVTLWFQPDSVLRLVAKAQDLGFQRWAISWPYSG